MKRRLGTMVVTALGMLILLATPALAEPVNLCGRLAEYTPARAPTTGWITVGSERFAISTDARSDVAPDVAVGKDVCLVGTWLMSQTAGRNLSEFQVRVQTASPSAPVRTLPSTATGSTVAPAAGVPAEDVSTLPVVALGVGALAALLIATAAVRARR